PHFRRRTRTPTATAAHPPRQLHTHRDSHPPARLGQAEHVTPALELLLGPQAAEVLAAAIAEYRGELTALAPVNVHVQPSGAVAVRYRAEVHRGDGRRSMEMLVATTADRIPPGATVVAGEHRGQPVEDRKSTRLN